jgi:hypothetical protein
VPAWTVPAWRGGQPVPLAELLSVVAAPEAFDWFVSRDVEGTGTPGAQAVLAVIYGVDEGTPVPYELIKAVADLDAQVFDGHIEVRRRGDEWDLESDDPQICEAIKQLPLVEPRPA